MCKMERTRGRGLKKVGDYVEVTFNDNNDYELCVTKCVSALSWDYGVSDGFPNLCRLSGGRVLNKSIVCSDGVTRRWTIGTYLRAAFIKTSQYKLGLALFQVS